MTCWLLMSLGLNSIPWFRGVNPVNLSPALEQSCSVCLGESKSEHIGLLETWNQHEGLFTGLMTILPFLTPKYSFGLWVGRFIKPYHSSQPGTYESPWETWPHLLLLQMGALLHWLLHSCTLGSIALMGLVIYDRVNCLIIQLALPSALYDS